jgi:hypothetical protein
MLGYMPVPAEHVAALHHNVEQHERRLAELRKVIHFAEEEAAVHEALIALARNDRLIAAAGEYCDDATLVSAFAADPHGRLQREGIVLPEGVTFDAIAEDESSSRLAAQLRCGVWNVEVGWERERGFFAIPDTRRLRQLPAVVSFVDTAGIDDEQQGVKSVSDASHRGNPSDPAELAP